MKRNNKPLDSLIGTELSSIEFVRDYIQIRFDGPCLNVITDPYILIGDVRYNRSDESFCNLLLTFIGSKVLETSLSIEDELIRLQFPNDRSINLSLKLQYINTAEAVTFTDIDGKWWVW